MTGQRTTHIRDFTEGNVTKQLLGFAAPLFLSNLLQIVYNMVDMIIVGRTLGKTGLSAVSVGGDVTAFLTFLAIGFSNAGQVLIAQYIGKGRRDELTRFAGTMFTFLMGSAALISVVCLFLRRQILTLMNTPAESFGEALAYVTVCMTGLVFIYGYNIVSAVLRGMGDSVRPFIFISVAAVVNTVLDLALVAGLGMGSRGAAIATVMSQGLSFVCCSLYILKNREKYSLTFRAGSFFVLDREMLAKLVKLGIPMAIRSAAIQASKLFVNSWINSYGVAVSAFAGIGNKINSTVSLMSNAVTTAGSSMVGQNIGAERYDRVRRIMLSVFGVMSVFASLLTLLILTVPEPIYRCFTDDAEVIAIGMTYVPVAILIFWGSTARSGMMTVINGSGNYRVNFATAILDGIVMRIGLSLLFGLAMDMRHLGFWLGDAAAGFTPLLIGIVFYMSGTWKKRQA